MGSELACRNLFSRTSVTATALTFGQALDSTVAGGLISYERQSKFPQQSYSGRSWILPTWRPHQELYIKQQPSREKHTYETQRSLHLQPPGAMGNAQSSAQPLELRLSRPNLPGRPLAAYWALRVAGLHWVNGSTLLIMKNVLSTDMILIWWNFPNGPFMLNG